MGLRLLAPAKADIKAIVAHIAAHNPRSALRWRAELDAKLQLLGDMPGIGAPRFEVRPGLRLLPFDRYNILYRVDGEDAVVGRVVHGARAWERLV